MYLTVCCQACTYTVLSGLYLQDSYTQFCELQKLHYLLHIPRQCVGCNYSVLSGIDNIHDHSFVLAKVALLVNHLMPNGHFSGRTAPLT
jgi:hypothetical protein